MSHADLASIGPAMSITGSERTRVLLDLSTRQYNVNVFQALLTMLLETETHIQADPADVFAFFAEMEENYEAWHRDHITFRWVEGEPLEEGTRAYFEEEIGGKVMKKTVKYVTVESNRHIQLKPTSRMMGFFLPFITFTIDPAKDGCVFTQQIKIRTGPIGKRLNRVEFAAVHEHMKEEGENLKLLMENGRESAAARSG